MSAISFRVLVDLFALGGAGFAMWKGRDAERLAAAIVLANVAIGMASKWLLTDSNGLIRLSNDGLAAVALLAVTLWFGALWMGGVMLFFAAQFSLHSYYIVTARPNDYLYALVNNIDWVGIVCCLIAGTLVAWRQSVRDAREAEPPA